MFKHAKVGEYVEILNSPFQGINVGDYGLVAGKHTDPKTHEKGYAVAFTKTWPTTFINERGPTETRVMWFPLDAVKIAPPDIVATLQQKEKEK